jgi:hypothetical protein
MKIGPWIGLLAISFILFLCTQEVAHAQIHVPANAEQKFVRITVHPAGEPRPALQYQLLPDFMQQTEGNAAVHYGKVTAARQRFFSDRDLWEKISQWARMPLNELPLDEVRETVQSKPVFDTLRRASRCRDCDWESPVRDVPFYEILIPEVQQLRNFARLIAVKARLEIAEGKYNQAVDTLQMGYALSRHAAAGETLIHSLVGIAISSVMSDQVKELIQQPNAPNLYWALCSLPTPLINGRQGMRAEFHALQLNFPKLQDLDRASNDPEYWRQILFEFWDSLDHLIGRQVEGRPEILMALALKGYPKAKQTMIDQGQSAEEVDAMPVAKVVLLDSLEAYGQLRDETFKWFYVPYWQAEPQMHKTDERLRQATLSNRQIIPLWPMFAPAVHSICASIARGQREIDVLKTIEALRMYLAEHDGQLPTDLDQLPVPAPMDPVTGKPFEYRFQDGVAEITGPPMPGQVLHVKIQVAPE